MSYFIPVKPYLTSVCALIITLSTTIVSPKLVIAQTPPPELKNTLAQIDQAANQQNVQSVMILYSSSFTNTDGLNYASLSKTLTSLWQRYPNLSYRTEIKSWQAQPNGFVAETITYITGKQVKDNQQIQLNSVVRSRQRFQNNKIIQQEILSERSQLSQGNQPPNVDFILPEQVKVGQSYYLDAIVKEPVGNDLLIGAVLEESINPNRYFQAKKLNFESLQSGGIFKIGKAPKIKGQYWISAVIMRPGGITSVTQRLFVVDGRK